MNVDWGHGRSAEAPRVNGLLAADPLFRHRAGDLESELVRAEIAAAFPEIGTSPPLEVVNVRYVPRRSLQVVYRAGRPGGAAAGGDTLLRVRFHPPGVSGHADGRSIPRLGAIGWVFPEDPELPQLAAVVHERYLARQLGAGGRWTPLSYVPGRRCALHHRVPGDPAGVVLRVQSPQEAAQSYARAQAVWRAGSRRFRMPEPLGEDLDSGAFWERFVPGEQLETLLGSARLDAAIEEVVRGVVVLHGLRVPGLPSQGTAEVLKRTTTKVLAQARNALPGLGAELDGFVRLLTAGAARLDDTAAVTLHGDLHTANVLVGAEGAVFIDLDLLAVGHPAYDLALLGTRLLLVGLHAGAGVHGIAARVAALPELYRQAGGCGISDETFAWHVAALLVGRQLKNAIRHLAPDAERLAATLLAWARRTLERGRFDPSIVRLGVEEVGNAREAAHAA